MRMLSKTAYFQKTHYITEKVFDKYKVISYYIRKNGTYLTLMA
jgi:hypothetical protein